MAGIQCKVDIPKIPGLDDQTVTVGREFYLNCAGDWPKNLLTEKVSFEGDENFKYQLKLLHFEFRSPPEADLTVTSYLAGPHKLANVILTDGAQKVELGPVDFEVKSVIEAKQGEKVEPFGPMGPATIPIPLVYWLGVIGVLCAFALVVGLRVWRYNQRRAMLEKLKQHESALSPLQEFHQSMRQLQRANTVFYGGSASPEVIRQGMEELSRMFKVYVSRRFSVPAFEWNERLILADIRKYHPLVYADYSRKIHDLFLEFKKAQVSDQKLQEKDVTQLAEATRKVIEAVERRL
jgi:hypothetical protein